MTTTNRRSVLFGLAAASTAAATGASATATAVRENSELVSLGNATQALQEQYVAARAEAKSIADKFAPIWPLAPEPILSFGSGCLEERDLTGAGIERIAEGRSRVVQVWRYGPPEYFEGQIRDHKARIAHIMTTKSKRGLKYERHWLARFEEALPLSRAYVEEIERIREQSGYEPSRQRKETAFEALRDHVNRIMAIDAVTMEGVVIKAQALGAWAKVDKFHKHLNLDGPKWAEELAAAILSQSEGRA